MLCKKHVFKTKIIKEYDIRGEFQKDLAERDAYFLGCSLGTYIKNRNNKEPRRKQRGIVQNNRS